MLEYSQRPGPMSGELAQRDLAKRLLAGAIRTAPLKICLRAFSRSRTALSAQIEIPPVEIANCWLKFLAVSCIMGV